MCWESPIRAPEAPPEHLPDDVEQPLLDLQQTYHGLTVRNLLESFHDAQEALDMAIERVRRRLSAVGSAQHRREFLLGDLPEGAEDGRRTPG